MNDEDPEKIHVFAAQLSIIHDERVTILVVMHLCIELRNRGISPLQV